METLWELHAVRPGISGLCAVSGAEKKPVSCWLMDLYGSASYHQHHLRASRRHRTLPLPLPQPHPFPGAFRAPLRQSPPRSRRSPGPSGPATVGVATERAGRCGRVDWPGLPRGRSSAISANRQRRRGGASRFNGGGGRGGGRTGCGWR